MAKKKSQSAESIARRKRVNDQALKQIDALRVKRDLSINKMCKEAGISAQAWFKWQAASASPTVEFLDKLAASMKGRLFVVVPEADQPLAGAPLVLPDVGSTESIGEIDEATKRILMLLGKITPETRHRAANALEHWLLEELGIAAPSHLAEKAAHGRRNK